MVLRSECYRDPAQQLERMERAHYRDRLHCAACEKRPAEVGGSGDCKRPQGGCGRFELDTEVVHRQAEVFGVRVDDATHRLLRIAGAGGSY